MVDELKRGPWKEKAGKIVVLKDVIQSLSKAALLHLALGSMKEVNNSTANCPCPSKFPTLFYNLTTLCMPEAWPSCRLDRNDTGKGINGRRFRGYYIDGLDAAQ